MLAPPPLIFCAVAMSHRSGVRDGKGDGAGEFNHESKINKEKTYVQEDNPYNHHAARRGHRAVGSNIPAGSHTLLVTPKR